MPHDTALIATVAAGLGVAFIFGLLAARLKLPPIVGYLLAGIVVGPFTPGYVADAGLASQLAEFGVILLMFGVGLRFSLQDLAEVRRVVVPGALAQIAITGSLSATIAYLWGWGPGGMLVLGLSTAVASTVVLLKGLEARDRLDSAEGRIAVGWLVVEDLAMVLALVLLPALAPVLGGSVPGGAASTSGFVLPVLAAMGKVMVFVLLMVFVGRRAVPWLLEHVAKVGSRELFTLAVLVSALGVGTVAAELFGVSFALGAFFAGAVISESELSQRAAADALPLQDAFAVLFFVSVGMLFQPSVIFERPMQLLALVAVVVVGKTAFAYGLMRLMRQSPRASLMLSAGLGQIGEFSFIVTALGVSMGLLPREGQALVVAAALIAITINGAVLSGAVRIAQRIAETSAQTELAIEMDEGLVEEPVAPPLAANEPAAARATTTSGVFNRTMPGRSGRGTVFSMPRSSGEAPFDFSSLADHVILVGYGRVGTTVGEALTRAGIRYVVVEERERVVGGLRKRGELAVYGDATRPDVLERAGISHARLLVVTAPDPIRARRIVEVARTANPHVAVAVRTHSATEQQFFEQYMASPGVTGRAVYAEREAALSLAHFSLLALGRTDDDADMVIDSMRGAPTRPTETFAAMPTTEFEAFLRASEAGRVRRRGTTTIPPTHADAVPHEKPAAAAPAGPPNDSPPRGD